MEVVEKDLINFQQCIRDHSGYDFSDYSLTSLRRRLTKILLEYDMSMQELIQRMETEKRFLEQTVRKLTVHTTELFRDPQVWKKIRDDLAPTWQDKALVNIWHPGCSTGQEVYSMLMLLDQLNLLHKTRVYGSDLNPDVLEKARRGRYRYQFNQSYLENFDKVMLNGSGEASDKPDKHWRKYFSVDESRDALQMHEKLCALPLFQQQDLVKDPNPFNVKYDLIVCRNVIIYFNLKLQTHVFRLFYENLQPGGALLLGVHESIMGSYDRKFRKNDPFYYKV
jgi:chemotaxis protein methyltransferase CheR